MMKRMMKNLRHGLIGMAAIAAVCLLQAPPAHAHPLGNFTINHYAGLEILQDGINIDYVLDMAEIPAFQEIRQLDTNQNLQPDAAETEQYPAKQCHQLLPQLNLQITQRSVPLALNRSTVEFPPGVGGLATLRLSCHLQGTMVTTDADQTIEFTDNTYPQRLGWREMTVNSPDLPVQGDFATHSISQRLTKYPNDLLSSPLNQRQVTFQLNPSQSASASSLDEPTATPSRISQALAGRSNDAFTRLMTLNDPSFSTILLALAISFVWGGLHALSPGHGKTVVGAYLVGARSRVQDALFLGLTVTLTHTAGIFALGFLTLSTSEFILTEQIFPWLSLLSGFMVTAIGLNLFIRRLRNTSVFQQWLQRQKTAFSHSHHHHHDRHPHDHNHSQSHSQSHSHDSHSHDALNHAHQLHNSGHAHDQTHPHPHDLVHSHDHVHHHNHGHSHLPPGADGTPVTWSSILALGISGGLLPCPSALVVLLSAISVGQIGFGLALVSAFSLGLAGVLTGIGLILVYAKQWFERLPLEAPKSRMIPVVSAFLITLIGIGITTQALFVQTL